LKIWEEREKLQMSETEKLLAFLSLHETKAQDSYLGALLVTNHQGVPQEFRCSQPVKPTAIQKPLYGGVLVPYIGVTLCGVPLIRSLKSKPSLIVLEKDFLLGVRPSITSPAVFVQRAGEAIEISAGTQENSTKRRKIDCPSGRFQPIIISPHYDYLDDLDVAYETLDSIFTSLDPLEPFKRIKTAIDVLAKQDERFQ